MKLIILAVAASLSLYACGQNIPAAKVPSVVQNTVQTSFAGAMNIEWEKKSNVYEAEFDKDSTEYTVYLDAGGKIILYKQDMKETELPAIITSAIARDHAGSRIDDADKIQKDGSTYYRVELDSPGKKDMNILYAADGKVAPAIAYIN